MACRLVSVRGMETLWQDLKHALRASLAQPGYLATALMTLALGIGFSTATFTVTNAVLLRPLPFHDPDRLVRLIERNLPQFPQFGVVGNVKQTSLGEPPRAQVYEPYLQHPYFAAFTLVVRTKSDDPTAVAPDLRGILSAMDAALPLARVRTLEQMVAGTIRGQRFSTTLIGLFGAAALLLAAVGVYGVIAYTVGLRRQEFAIRIAHGARPRDIARLVLRGAAGLSSAGIAIGGLAARLIGGTFEAMLFNVSPADPWTYASIAAVLGSSALAATAIPAMRAMRVNPIEALRYE